MATKLKEGDAVQVVDREATPADEKSRTFFNHYRNARGILEKLYEDGTATVVLEADTLPDEIRARHADLTEKARQKWLDGLSSEARSRLTPEEQQFDMRYTILVEAGDLLPAGSAPAKQSQAGAASAESAPRAARKARDPEAKPVTSSDLDQAEEEFLRQRQQSGSK